MSQLAGAGCRVVANKDGGAGSNNKVTHKSSLVQQKKKRKKKRDKKEQKKDSGQSVETFGFFCVARTRVAS